MIFSYPSQNTFGYNMTGTAFAPTAPYGHSAGWTTPVNTAFGYNTYAGVNPFNTFNGINPVTSFVGVNPAGSYAAGINNFAGFNPFSGFSNINPMTSFSGVNPAGSYATGINNFGGIYPLSAANGFGFNASPWVSGMSGASAIPQSNLNGACYSAAAPFSTLQNSLYGATGHGLNTTSPVHGLSNVAQPLPYLNYAQGIQTPLTNSVVNQVVPNTFSNVSATRSSL